MEFSSLQKTAKSVSTTLLTFFTNLIGVEISKNYVIDGYRIEHDYHQKLLSHRNLSLNSGF